MKCSSLILICLSLLLCAWLGQIRCVCEQCSRKSELEGKSPSEQVVHCCLKAADDFAKSRHHRSAASAYELVIQQYPELLNEDAPLDLYMKLGDQYMHIKMYEEAMTAFQVGKMHYYNLAMQAHAADVEYFSLMEGFKNIQPWRAKIGSLYEEQGKHQESANEYMFAASACWDTHRYKEAAEWYLKAGEQYLKTKENENAGKVFSYSGAAYLLAKDEEKSAMSYERAGKSYKSVNKQMSYQAYIQAAETYVNFATRSTANIIQPLEKAKKIYAKLNRMESVASCLYKMAEKYVIMARGKEAATLFEEAGQMFDTYGNRRGAGLSYSNAKSTYSDLAAGEVDEKIIEQYQYKMVLNAVNLYDVRFKHERGVDIVIDRPSIIAALVGKLLPLSRQTPQMLREKGIYVKFENEEGQGPSVLAEFFTELARVMLARETDEEPYFIQEKGGHVFVPNPLRVSDEDLDFSEVLGVLIALAIRTKQQIPIPFAQGLLKQMISDVEIVLDDMQDYDPVVYENLKKLLAAEDASSMQISNAWENVPFGTDENEIVINENREAFVKNVLRMTWENKRTHIQRMKDGFRRIAFTEVVDMLTARTFAMLLTGEQEIDVNEWEKATFLSGFTANDQIIKWFWEIVKEMTSAELHDLLAFWSGKRTLPHGSFSKVGRKFVIIKNRRPYLQMPIIARPCIFQIQLLQYESKEVLREKLMYAITHPAGLGHVQNVQDEQWLGDKS